MSSFSFHVFFCVQYCGRVTNSTIRQQNTHTSTQHQPTRSQPTSTLQSPFAGVREIRCDDNDERVFNNNKTLRAIIVVRDGNKPNENWKMFMCCVCVKEKWNEWTTATIATSQQHNAQRREDCRIVVSSRIGTNELCSNKKQFFSLVHLRCEWIFQFDTIKVCCWFVRMSKNASTLDTQTTSSTPATR